MATCAYLSMWTQQQLPLLQFHCGPLWSELQPSQANEVNNRVFCMSHMIHLTQKERPTYARISQRVNTLGPACFHLCVLHSFEAPDLVDSTEQELSAAHGAHAVCLPLTLQSDV
jgi:hypothetical protein